MADASAAEGKKRKRVVVKKKIVVKKVKRTKGFLDELDQKQQESLQQEKQDAYGSQSDSTSDDEEELDKEVGRRRSLRNENLLNRFTEKNSGNFIEAEVAPPREVPLIGDDIKEALRKRREAKAEAKATPTREGSHLSLPPATPAGLQLESLGDIPRVDSFVSESSTPGTPTTPLPHTPRTSSFFGENATGMIEFEKEESTIPQQRMPMWCTRAYTHPNRFIRLHDEMVDLVKYLRPTHEEDFMRKKVVLDMSRIARELFPGSHLLAFGSVITGLILPMSDVDMTIMHAELEGDLDSLHTAMDKLADYIAGKGLCDDAYPQVIKQTKVPIVKFTHRETWIDVDISFNAPNGRINSEMIVRYCKKIPIVAPLIFVVKYFLQQRSMNEPFTGGLGSYAVSLMVISFIQHHMAFRAEADATRVGAGGLLMDFFRFYGVIFDYNVTGISVKNAHFFRKNRQEMNDRASFLLQDPQNASNNVTSASRQLSSIRSAFHHAFLALASDSFPYVPDSEKSAEHPLISNRPTLLSRVIHIDRAMLDRRIKVAQAYERWVEANPTKSPSDFLQQFEEEQVSGHEVQEILERLCEGVELDLVDGLSDEAGEDGVYSI